MEVQAEAFAVPKVVQLPLRATLGRKFTRGLHFWKQENCQIEKLICRRQGRRHEDVRQIVEPTFEQRCLIRISVQLLLRLQAAI